MKQLLHQMHQTVVIHHLDEGCVPKHKEGLAIGRTSYDLGELEKILWPHSRAKSLSE